MDSLNRSLTRQGTPFTCIYPGDSCLVMPAMSKGQKTISSFFAAKPGATSHIDKVQNRPFDSTSSRTAPVSTQIVPNKASSDAHKTQYPDVLARDEEDGEEDIQPASLKRNFSRFTSTATPEPKRRKVSDELALDTLHEPEQSPKVVTPQLVRQASAKITDRTARYLFNADSNCPTPQGGPEAEDDDEGDDREAIRLRKADLHQRFVRKLGRPDSFAELKRRNHLIEDHAAGEAEDLIEEDELPTEPTSKSRSSSAPKKGAQKLTPMEQQVVDIKRNNMDTLIVVEVGYKFRFFGEDARIAARELSIVCIPGKMRFDDHPSEAHLTRFASASIPTHRLHVHVKRLVAAGLKVGVVRQLETAALKAVGDNRNTPFVRKLTNVYTKGTYIDDIETLDSTPETSSNAAPSSGHLLCLTETSASWATDEKVHVGLIAVQPSTGDVIYDDFEDGFMRSEIETRLLHISPCEFVLVGDLSKATEKLVQHLSGSKANVFGDKVRVERVPKGKTAAADASRHLSLFYESKMKDKPDGLDEAAILEKLRGLSELTTICLSAMIKHMSQYGLEHVFDLTKNFQAFSSRSHMLLNGNTLSSLEIYRNQTDNTEHGSLFWILDRTTTKFGQRLLRKWVGRPLLAKNKLEERINAVEELKDTQNTMLRDKLQSTLAKARIDLERSLIRVYYGKCTRPELLSVLQTLQGIASDHALVKNPQDAGFTSSLLNESVASLPRILQLVISFLDRINAVAAKEDDKYNFFTPDNQTDAIAIHKCGIADVESELHSHRAVAAERLKKKTVEYVTVAGIDYLIEVRNADVKSVPASWMKISGTKAVSRFHTPEVVRMIRERDQHTESLAAAADEAFSALLLEISSHYSLLRDAVSALATLDVLLSLSIVAAQPGYVKPHFVEQMPNAPTGPHIDVNGARHPMVEQHLLSPYVPNNVKLSPQERAILLTGPNMGGKSSYVRSIALICIMAQIGCYVPADSATLGLVDAVFTRMGARDNMLKGESTFMVELGETSEILKVATRRSLVILDELGRGTSTFDGVSIAMAVLEWTVREVGCGVLFVTHYQSLARMADVLLEHGMSEVETRPLRNMHMKFATSQEGLGGGDGGSTPNLLRDKAAGHQQSDDDEEITFLYEAAPGTAHRSYGLNVARLANVPSDVIQVARSKSAEMEAEMKRAQFKGVALMARKGVENESWLDEIVSGIEAL